MPWFVVWYVWFVHGAQGTPPTPEIVPVPVAVKATVGSPPPGMSCPSGKVPRLVFHCGGGVQTPFANGPTESWECGPPGEGVLGAICPPVPSHP